MVGRRPLFAPLFHRFGVVKSPWSLFKERQVVQGIKNILLPFVASAMTGKEFGFVVDVHLERIGFERDLSSCPADRNGVAVGFKGGLAVRSQANRYHCTAVIGKRWQGS